MTYVIAIYVFRDADTTGNALEHLWRHLDRGIERSAGNEIWINSSCMNPRLAGQICESLGGVGK